MVHTVLGKRDNVRSGEAPAEENAGKKFQHGTVKCESSLVTFFSSIYRPG